MSIGFAGDRERRSRETSAPGAGDKVRDGKIRIRKATDNSQRPLAANCVYTMETDCDGSGRLRPKDVDQGIVLGRTSVGGANLAVWKVQKGSVF